MVVVASQDNKIYKYILKLGMKKYRDSFGEFIAEGINIVREALENEMIITQIAIDYHVLENNLTEELRELISELSSLNCSITYFSPNLFRKMADADNPQGILAVIKKEQYNIEQFAPNGNIIVLDRLQDPGNIGTILRTADGGGYSCAFILKGTADIYSSKVVRAAAGSLFRFPVVFFENPKEVLSQLNSMGKTIFCADLSGTENYYSTDLKNNVALIIGNEGNGISASLLVGCHKIVKIPMMGTLESLNVAVAAGILIYESMRE